jgi:transcriptional regulator with XRE-family HTH domain
MQHQTRRTIGARLKQARLAAKLTQENVASDLLCTRQAISAWENGKTLPTLIEFRELASLYGVSTDLLLYGLDDIAAAGPKLLARIGTRGFRTAGAGLN